MIRSVLENSDCGAAPSGRELAGKVEAEVTIQFSHDARRCFDANLPSHDGWPRNKARRHAERSEGIPSRTHWPSIASRLGRSGLGAAARLRSFVAALLGMTASGGAVASPANTERKRPARGQYETPRTHFRGIISALSKMVLVVRKDFHARTATQPTCPQDSFAGDPRQRRSDSRDHRRHKSKRRADPLLRQMAAGQRAEIPQCRKWRRGPR